LGRECVNVRIAQSVEPRYDILRVPAWNPGQAKHYSRSVAFGTYSSEFNSHSSVTLKKLRTNFNIIWKVIGMVQKISILKEIDGQAT
jgi:hypothetical protein